MITDLDQLIQEIYNAATIKEYIPKPPMFTNKKQEKLIKALNASNSGWGWAKDMANMLTLIMDDGTDYYILLKEYEEWEKGAVKGAFIPFGLYKEKGKELVQLVYDAQGLNSTYPMIMENNMKCHRETHRNNLSRVTNMREVIKFVDQITVMVTLFDAKIPPDVIKRLHN